MLMQTKSTQLRVLMEEMVASNLHFRQRKGYRTVQYSCLISSSNLLEFVNMWCMLCLQPHHGALKPPRRGPIVLNIFICYVAHFVKRFISAMIHGMGKPSRYNLRESKASDRKQGNRCKASSQESDGYKGNEAELFQPIGFIEMLDFIQHPEIFLGLLGN